MKSIRICFLAIVFFLLFPITHGLSQENLFFVFLNSNPDRETLSETESVELQKAHLANIDSLYAQGKLTAAGPFDGGGGIFILVAKDSVQAEKLLHSDPAIEANRFQLEYFPFRIGTGGTCRYNEPVKMKSFTFLRWTLKDKEKLDEVISTRLTIKQNDFYTETHLRDSILIAGTFEKANQGIMVLHLSSEAEAKLLMETSPIHNSGKFDYTVQKLWTAEGTFCRKEE